MELTSSPFMGAFMDVLTVYDLIILSGVLVWFVYFPFGGFMAHVSGPVSSMPGSTHAVVRGSTRCDDHPNRLAVKRIQGETDSFGAEYHDLCQECVDKMRRAEAQRREELGTCDWCGTSGVRVLNRRDMDEGMSGPIYKVCGDCIARELAALDEELEEGDPYRFAFDEDDSEDTRRYKADRNRGYCGYPQRR